MGRTGPSRAELEAEIQRLEEALVAREGELGLTRLHLARLGTILQESEHHEIPVDLAESIYDVAAAEGIEPRVAFSLVRVESEFFPRAISSAGAVGLTQVMPSTAFSLDPELEYHDLFVGETNLRLGFRYLRRMIEQYGGNLDLALSAYNRGPGRVDAILRRGGDPSNGYSRAVLGSLH
jgi:soluble lytic murein transglycosylase-like protein